MTDLQHIFSSHDLLGEGPLWDPVEQNLYWVNIETGQYHRLDPVTGVHQLVEVGEMVGVLALREKGGMVMATNHGFAFWDPAQKSWSTSAIRRPIIRCRASTMAQWIEPDGFGPGHWAMAATIISTGSTLIFQST